MKHAIDRSAWDPRERDDYEDLLADVCNSSPHTPDRLDAFEAKLADAMQAHRPWASDVARACQRFGMAKELKRFLDRSRALVAFDGQLLSMPRMQSRRVVVAGEPTFQRELIELWTWEQILDKRAEAIQAARTYTAKVNHYDRLLALRELAPDSTTPAEAADAIGIDLDDYLGKAA